MTARGLDPAFGAADEALLVEGNLRASREAYDAAYREAEGRGDEQGMALAALGLGGLWVHEHRGAADAAMVWTRLRRSLALVDPRSSPGLRLRIRMAAEADYRVGEHSGILAMLAEARRAGDPVAFAEALSLTHHCVLGPEHAALRQELARELIGEAPRTGRRSDLLMGLMWNTVDGFLSADPHAERYLEELRAQLAEREHLAVGFVVAALGVMRDIRAGRLAEAEAEASACADRGADAGDIDTTGWFVGQLAVIRWYQGRGAEFLPLLSELVSSPTLSPVDYSYFAALGVAAASVGDHRLATGALARIRGRALAELPRSSSWLTTMYAVVETAHLLRGGSADMSAEVSAEAYELLLPFAHLPVIVSLGVACLGSVQHCLGVASLTLGQVDRAVGHLRAAVHDNVVLGHWPAVALSRARLGQALALRDGIRDETAIRELTLAEQEAAALGMALPAPVRPVEQGAEAGPRAPAVCWRRGRQWWIELGGRTVCVAHSVGMDHLSILLANPGQEIPAVELAAGPGLRGPSADESAATAGQAMLDEVAVREYKERLEQLRDEIGELEALNDYERVAATRAERDWLLDELAAATGMGGRARQFADNQQRARLAVGKAIRRALNRITEADPILGAELRATVHTGVRCCYRPGPIPAIPGR
ncbi:hypothetical protein J5X84_08480 [Streptosporangiaceae bacterium NEAU-GS5]|nr:hypothetical protein [Streptosporangiaceae bacterium NEAU-GS5]